MTVAYPATVIGDTEAPVRQSWNLTRRQALWLVSGNLLTVLPALLAGLALFMGLAGILQFIVPMPEMGQETGQTGVLLAQIVVKIAISVWSLLFFALLSAFHAHAYAYLVRSSSSVSSH
jgi:hypothetical protein